MVVNAKKVQRLMREDNLLAERKAPFLKSPADRPRPFFFKPEKCRCTPVTSDLSAATLLARGRLCGLVHAFYPRVGKSIASDAQHVA
jgi:hypothetical protein